MGYSLNKQKLFEHGENDDDDDDALIYFFLDAR